MANVDASQHPEPESGNDPQDRRADGEKRLVTTLLVAHLLTPRDDGLCRVRNISSGGARLETPMPLRPGDEVRVELRGEIALVGHICWTSPGAAGMQFTAPVDTDMVLHGSEAGVQWHHRMPRIPTQCPVTARQHGRIVHADMMDINPCGARLTNLQLPLADGLFTLNIPQLDPVEGTIRWRKEESAGVRFTRPIPFSVLAGWLHYSPARFALR
ncbi:PilZ domain-containing protein [Stakelama sp. CBK3Z-3]|uniref:PilZ domain-containing protein n=1 Tax=Stakelama flava TaxID=2860338 RepID=A0ABS6XJQ5_9SPHN|nr:PilZ domain-containing protein [Stakelama flava]MBW4330422.1 PilZ domain-containing protein [Stakelama flava]